MWNSPEEFEFIMFAKKYGFEYERMINGESKEDGLGFMCIKENGKNS